jgi:hypothetical protein
VQLSETSWGWGVLLDYRKFDSAVIKPHVSIGFGYNVGNSGTSSSDGSVVTASAGTTESASGHQLILSILLQVMKSDAVTSGSKDARDSKPAGRDAKDKDGSGPPFTIGPLAPSLSLEDENRLAFAAQAAGDALVPEVVQVSLSAIRAISQIKLDLPRDLLSKETSRRNLFKSLREIRRRFRTQNGSSNAALGVGSDDNFNADALPLLDPVKDIGINTQEFKTLLSREKELVRRMEGSPVHAHPQKKLLLERYQSKCALLEAARVCRQSAKESQTLTMKQELRKRKNILSRLGYTSGKG